MIEHFDVSLMHERRGQIQREVAANRLEKRLRQGRVQRATLLSALLETVWRAAGSRSGRKAAQASSL